MIIAEVSYCGIRPLLMHSNAALMTQSKGPVGGPKEVEPKVQAEQGAYRDDQGYLVIPARNIKANIVVGARVIS